MAFRLNEATHNGYLQDIGSGLMVCLKEVGDFWETSDGNRYQKDTGSPVVGNSWPPQWLAIETIKPIKRV